MHIVNLMFLVSVSVCDYTCDFKLKRVRFTAFRANENKNPLSTVHYLKTNIKALDDKRLVTQDSKYDYR